MRFKRAASIALGLSLSTSLLVEAATSAAYGETFFGFNVWPIARPSYPSPMGAVYPPLKVVAQRHVHKKTHRHYASKGPLAPIAQKDTTPAEWTVLAKRLAIMQKANPGALNVFLNDDTLRRKDAVMTSTGIFIFRGENSGYHMRQDFVSLTRSTAIPHRVELAAIEKVSVPRFEVAQSVSPAKTQVFVDVRPSTKSFEPVETRAVRHIAGVHWYE